MPTDLLDLPGYPGHAQARSFADECVRGVSEEVLESDAALLAELSRRVASIPEDSIASLESLSAQTRRLRLRVWLNSVDADTYNAWSAPERLEQLRWRGSTSTTAQGQRSRWTAWYGLSFNEEGTASPRPAVANEDPPADAPAEAPVNLFTDKRIYTSGSGARARVDTVGGPLLY